MTTPVSAQEASLTPSSAISSDSGGKKDDRLPIIRNSRQASGVSLSPRSGLNEPSEWRTACKAVDGRGGAPPQTLSNQRGGPTRATYTANTSAFRLTGLRFRG